MRLTSFVVSRSWASSPLRPALSLAGVGLGIAIAVSIHVLDHNTVATDRRTRGSGADLELAPLDPLLDPARARAELLAVDGVASASALLAVPARVEDPAVPAGLSDVTLFGVEPAAPGPYRSDEGAAAPAGEDGCLLARDLAARLGLAVGSQVVLAPGPGAAGVDCERSPPVPLPDPEPIVLHVSGLLAPERLGRERGGRAAVARFETARRLSPRGPVVYHLVLGRGASAERIEAAVSGRFAVTGRREAALGDAADRRAFRNGVKVLGLLALVLGMFVIFSTLSQSLVERLKRIGLLRALGATPGDVGRIVLADAAVLSVCGAAAGLGLGLLLAKLLIEFRVTTLGLGKRVSSFEIPLLPVAGILALGVAFTLAGALLPLLRARRLPPLAVLAARDLRPPADLLAGVNVLLFVLLLVALPASYLALSPLARGRGPESLVVMAQAGGILAGFFGILLAAPGVVRTAGSFVAGLFRRAWPLQVFLVQRELRRSPGRVAASVSGLAAVCLAIVTLHSVTEALGGETRRFADAALRDRLFVRCAPIEPEAARTLLAGVEGVSAVDPLVPRSGAPFEAVGLERPGPLRDARKVVVSLRLAALKGLAPGDPLVVPGPCGPETFFVDAIDDGAGSFAGERVFVAMDRRWVERDTGISAADRVVLGIAPGTDWSALVRGVRETLPGVAWIRSGWSIERDALREIGRDFVIFDILLFLILVLAGVGLVNAMTIAALARTKELGVLSALGLSRRDLFSIFAIEAGVVGTLAGLASVVLSLPVAWVVVRGLRAVSGLGVPFSPPFAWIAAVPAIAFVTSLAASLLPAARLARISPARAVRYE